MEFSSLASNVELLLLLIATPWVLLALFAAFADSGVGFIDEWLLAKLGKDENEDTEIDAAGRLVLISGFFGAVVALCALLTSLILGSSYSVHISAQGIAYGFGAGVLEVMWLIPYFYALQKGGAINTTPLFQTIPLFALFFGFTIFNEIPTLLHIIATLLIIVGASVLNYSPQTKRIDRFTITLMLISSAIISLGFFFFKDATEQGNFVATLFWNGVGMTAVSSAIWMVWKPYRLQFNNFIKTFDVKVLFLQITNEGLYALGAIVNQLAIVLGPSVMVVSAFNGFHPIFTLLIGWFLARKGSQVHKETLAGKQLLVKSLAIALIAAGAVLVVL